MKKGEAKEKKERKLTEKELDTLKLVYRFRFATNHHLAVSQGIHNNSARLRAARLHSRGYLDRVGRDKQAIIDRVAGAYKLTSKASALLKKEDPKKYLQKALRSMIAQKEPSQDFIDKNLNIYNIYNKLRSHYKEDLIFITKTAMVADKFNYLPEVRPDSLIQLKKHFFFLYFLNTATPDFAHLRKVKPVIDYASSGIWQNKTNQELPMILIVTELKRTATTILIVVDLTCTT